MLTAGERRAWLAARRLGMTGTDIAAILGLNPWRRPIDIYCEKLGLTPAREANEAMWWGSYLEEGMARRYAELTKLPKGELLRGAAIAKAFPKNRVQVFGHGPSAQVLIRHKSFSFLYATVDGLIPSLKTGLELKTASDHTADEWGEQGTDQIPIHYLTQCAHYLAIAEFDVWDVGALIGMGARISGNLALYRVQRNRSLESEIIDAAVRFWRENVQKRIPPAMDGSEGWQSYLARKYAHATGRVLRATPRIYELAAQYRDAQKRRQEAEDAELLMRNLLGASIRSADKAQGEFGTVGWVRPSQQRVTDWEALAHAMKPTAAQIARFTHTEQNQPYIRAWWSKKGKKR